MNKVINLVAIAVGMTAAWWTFKQLRPASSSAPDPAEQYHARNNPNGWIWNPGLGAYTRTTPEGVTEIST